MSEQLLSAQRDGTLVRFYRRFEDYRIAGYVSAIGETWFLLALISDRIRFDGFECFRIADINTFEANPQTAFIESALAARGETRPDATGIDVTDLPAILRSAAARFPVITLHEEEENEGCGIGRLVGIEGGVVWLLEIDPDAVWDETPETYRLSDVTRVNFGGDYETALHMVGGEPPETPRPRVAPLRLVSDNS